MKLSEKLLTELNLQYNLELHSAFLYKHMSIWANKNDFPGMSHWFEKQFKEEMEHAEKIYQYIFERNADVTLDTIAKPEGEWSSMLEVMQAALKHEEFISSRFTEISLVAMADKDFASLKFLAWFHTEQVEEEEQGNYWVNRLAKAGDNVGAQMIIDNEMGARA